jgi:hypothetical protein
VCCVGGVGVGCCPSLGRCIFAGTEICPP